MTRYIVKLTEQEELAIKQYVLQPGFDVLLKFLQGESLDAQTTAMECEGNMEARALAQMQAQMTKNVVSNLTKKLSAYRQIQMPQAEEQSNDPLTELLRTDFSGRTN